MELAKCAACQKTYGLSTDSIKLREAVFQEELGIFPIEKIRGAFQEHRRQSPEFPTLACIMNRIETVGQRVLRQMREEQYDQL